MDTERLDPDGFRAIDNERAADRQDWEDEARLHDGVMDRNAAPPPRSTHRLLISFGRLARLAAMAGTPRLPGTH